MKPRIIIITNNYSKSFVQNTLGEVSLDCDIKIMEYTNFNHIIQIYRENEETADGFVVSGSTTLAAVTKILPEHKKPIVSFNSGIMSLYRLLLQQLLKNRGLDVRRIIFDSMIPVTEDPSIEHFLNTTASSLMMGLIGKWLEQITVPEIENLEEYLKREIIKRWDNHEIDLVICYYGSIMTALKQHGIPCCYPEPSKEDLLEPLRTLLSQLELDYLKENLPGVIAVSEVTDNRSKKTMLPLKKALTNIIHELALDVIMQEDDGKYYIFTTQKVIDFITDHLQVCKICFSLKKQYRINAYTGYGIGTSITKAQDNARNALKEALFSKGCFAIDEQLNLTGPLDAKKQMEIHGGLSKEIYITAKQCKLSTLTIQKILSVINMTGSNQITQQSLAKHLGVTTRNAGRILGNLEKGGAASIIYTQSVTSKGRPIKVYELNIKA